MKNIRDELLLCVSRIQSVNRAIDEMRNYVCEKDQETAQNEISNISLFVTNDLAGVAKILNNLAESVANLS